MRSSNRHVCAWKNPTHAQIEKEKREEGPRAERVVFHLPFAPGCFFPLDRGVLHLQALKDFSFLRCCFVSRGFGTVCMAVETATGEEVSVKLQLLQLPRALPSAVSCGSRVWVAGRALLQRQMKC